MKDYANKDWLRPTAMMLRNLAAFLWDVMIVALLAFFAAWVITANEARAQGARLYLLETSMRAADGDECERKFGWRPDYTVSKNDRTGEPYHHRTCAYHAK